MTTASITIETRPFLDMLEHLAAPPQMVNEVIVTFDGDTLSLDAETVGAVFKGKGEGQLEVVLARKQARWLADITRARLPEQVVVSATLTSLTVHNDTMSWSDVPESDATARRKQLDDLDLVTAFITIDPRQLGELELLEAAGEAMDRVNQALDTAASALAPYQVTKKRLRTLIEVQAVQRLEDWRETCNSLAEEYERHPREGFYEPPP